MRRTLKTSGRYRNLDEVLQRARERERDDFDVDSYAERQKKKFINMLRTEDFRNGSVEVEVSGGGRFTGMLNEAWYGQEGREYEAQFYDEDNFIKKGANKVTLQLINSQELFVRDKNGNAIGLINDKTTDEQAIKAWDHFAKIVKERTDAAEQNDKNADYTKMPPYVDENGRQYFMKYDLRMWINDERIEKHQLDDAFKQMGRVGSFSHTNIENGVHALKNHTKRGAAFFVGRVPVDGTVSVLKSPIKGAKETTQQVSSMLSRVMQVMSQGTRTR